MWLKFILCSDGAFGRGDGVAGLVDAEIQHDEYGLPYLSGRTLKGLLAAECAEILDALRRSCRRRSPDPLAPWEKAGRWLFGVPGSVADTRGHLFVWDACLPSDLRRAIQFEFDDAAQKADDQNKEGELSVKQKHYQLYLRNLESLTTIRSQTAMDAGTGAPLRNTLRTMRLIVHETPFIARLDFDGTPEQAAMQLLAACVTAFHRAGTGRNRGRGLLRAGLYKQEPLCDSLQPVTPILMKAFEAEVRRVCA